MTLSERFNQQREEAEVAIADAENRWCGNRVRVLSRVWIVTQLCVLALVISGFAVGPVGGSIDLAFLGVLVACLSIFLSIIGAVILRKHRTPHHHGFLLGASSMMSMIMLISAVAFGSPRDCNQGNKSAQAAVCAFSIALFFLHLIFSIMLYKWRNDIVVYDQDDFDGEGMEMGSHSGASTSNLQTNEGEGDLKMV